MVSLALKDQDGERSGGSMKSLAAWRNESTGVGREGGACQKLRPQVDSKALVDDGE